MSVSISICVIGSSICDLGLAFPFSSSNESLTFCCDPLLGGLTGVVTPPLDPLLPRVVGREDFSGIGDALLGLFAALKDFCDETVLPFPLTLPACLGLG